MGLTLLDERDRQRLSSQGSQERRRTAAYSVPLESNRGSSRVTFGPDHWSVLASVDARLEERREIAALYRRYEKPCLLKPCQVKLKRVHIDQGKRKPRKKNTTTTTTTHCGLKQTRIETATTAKAKKTSSSKSAAKAGGERKKRPPTSLLRGGGGGGGKGAAASKDDEKHPKEDGGDRKLGEDEELLVVQDHGSAAETTLTIISKNKEVES